MLPTTKRIADFHRQVIAHAGRTRKRVSVLKDTRLRVSKKSTLSWSRMPFARKSKISGLHSILANTTPVPPETRIISGFSLIRSFSDAHVAGKTKCAFAAGKSNFRFIDRLKRVSVLKDTRFYYLPATTAFSGGSQKRFAEQISCAANRLISR